MNRYALSWWKILTLILLVYTVIAGFLFPVPHLLILNESIRLFYFHFPMWIAMTLLFMVSVVSSMRYLSTSAERNDDLAVEAARVGFVFGLLGLLTGMIWAKATWGTFWTNDTKLNNTAITLLIYLAYFILRNSFEDEQRKQRLSAIYNIFAFAAFIPLVFIIPRMTDSLHPGNGGNATFRLFDTSHDMKLVIYTAIAGFTLLGFWILNILIRIKAVNRTLYEKD